MLAAENLLSRKVREEQGDSVLKHAEENGGRSTRVKEIKILPLFTNTSVRIVERNSEFMAIRNENTAAITVI